MSFYRGPNIVTNGLVLNLDAGNGKSYPGSGTTWSDKSGNNNNATLVNSPTFNSQNLGSIIFNGSNNYVSIANSNSINFGTGSSVQFTIETCFKFTDISTTRVIIANRQTETSPDTDYILFYSPSTFTWGTGTSADTGAWWNVNSAFTGGTMQNNSIYYISATLTATGTTTGNKTFFCNGNTISTTYAQKANKTTNPIIIGKGAIDNNFYMQGNIYFFRIYNRALSTTEITQNYNALKSRFNLT